tara:strand:- start:5080 stop:6084 length:1005 start_codon:yes stop_codon:yes gene_type:complete
LKNSINYFLKNKINLKAKNNFALILGSSPSKGARSPILWNNAYKFFGKKIKMFPADISEKNLKDFSMFLKSNSFFLGGSVTIPYKEKFLNYLDKIDKNAKKIGSINTIINKEGYLFGLNTDYYGSLFTLKKIIKRNHKNVLILGCGGAGKACVISVLNYFKGSKIFLYNRNKKKLIKFLKKIEDKENKVKGFSDINFLKKIKKLDIIINSTSVGFDSWIKDSGYFNLKNFSPTAKVKIKKVKKIDEDNFLLTNKKKLKENILNTVNFLSKFNKLVIFDIIYQPKSTILMKIGSLLGHKVYNGLQMNFMQAVEAFYRVNNAKEKNKVILGMQNGK